MFGYLKLIRECCFITIFLVLFVPIAAFNFDLTTPIVYYGSKGSMFGYTIAPYKLNGESWVLIGAPKNRDEYFSRIERNYSGGSVYYCNVDPNKPQCKTIIFPIQNNKYTRTHHIEQQGLGASLVTSGLDGAVAVCAPRVYMISPFDQTYPIGTCYYSKTGFNNFAEFGKEQHFSLRHGQVGFSVTVSKDSMTLYSGAVCVLHDPNKNNATYPGYISSLNMDNKIKGRKEEDIAEALTSHASSYFGYSITNLNFHNTPITGVAVASPKAEDFRGKVSILTSNFASAESKDLVGEQFAAYFGYSICTSDMDGDGADDLIIGAPLYSHNFSSLNQFYENGRIYVYYQGNESCSRRNSICWNDIFNKFDTIDGEHSKGRFGFAIASIGDINRDGFGDIAVGAPYEEFTDFQGTPHTGAVYIYHGSSQGIVKHPSQVIRASEVYILNQVQTLSLNSFGSSVSGGLDLDGNSYADLVIGAHESDVAFLFRSKPIINLIAHISFSKSVIALDEESCKLKDGTTVPCVQLQICLQYDSVAENQIVISTEIVLDYEQSSTSRMFFLDNERNSKTGYSMVLQKDKQICKEMTTYVAQLKQDEDKFSPILAQLSCSLITPKTKNKNTALTGILNSETTSVIKKASLYIKNNCGDDNICIPDLRISMKSNVEKFVLGSVNSNILDLHVSVLNGGEDSYRSIFYLKLPQGLGFSYSKPISCPTPSSDNNFTITCRIGNPVPKGEMINFTIVFEVLDSTNVKNDIFTFLANVNSTNLNLNTNPQPDDEKSFNISIVEKPNLSITGSSSPIEIFNVSSYNFDYIESDMQAGPVLLHRYFIKNLGFMEISEAIAVFHWPQKLDADAYCLFTGFGSYKNGGKNQNRSSGKFHVSPLIVKGRYLQQFETLLFLSGAYIDQNLLYLIAQPITGGSIECDHIDNLNYENLKLDYSYDHLLIPDNDANNGMKKDISEKDGKIFNAQNADSTPILNEFKRGEMTESPLRKRRQVDSKVTDEKSCLLGQCTIIQCKIKHLKKNQAVSIVFPSVVWAKTFQNDLNKTVHVGSYVQVNVTKQAHRLLPSDEVIPPKQIFTNIKLLKIEKRVSEGKWSNIGSASIGILILALIIYVLYKLGFFKRNRPANLLEENLVAENCQELGDDERSV